MSILGWASAAWLSLQGAISGAPAVGVRHLDVYAPERRHALSVTIWYPAADGGEPVRIGANGVFRGVPAREGAKLADGHFPVVVVSAGGMRAAPDLLAWLDRDLAIKGFVVADVHADPLGAKDAARASAEIWKRPEDLSAALSGLLEMGSFSGQIESDKIAALGAYLGGTATLQLAGARIDPRAYAQSCSGGATGVDCTWYAQSGVDLHHVNTRMLARSNADPRIGFVVALNPELMQSLSIPSLAAMRTQAVVLGLGQAGGAGGLTTKALQFQSVPGTSAQSAFGLCKSGGAALLAKDGGESAICTSDGGTKGRQAAHDAIAAQVATLLQQGFDAMP